MQPLLSGRLSMGLQYKKQLYSNLEPLYNTPIIVQHIKKEAQLYSTIQTPILQSRLAIQSLCFVCAIPQTSKSNSKSIVFIDRHLVRHEGVVIAYLYFIISLYEVLKTYLLLQIESELFQSTENTFLIISIACSIFISVIYIK